MFNGLAAFTPQVALVFLVGSSVPDLGSHRVKTVQSDFPIE